MDGDLEQLEFLLATGEEKLAEKYRKHSFNPIILANYPLSQRFLDGRKNQIEKFNKLVRIMQIISITNQILSSLPHNNHKYVAHQVALLYSHICYFEFNDLKSDLNSNFKAIKETVSNYSCLDRSQVAWMTEFLQNLRHQAEIKRQELNQI